MNISDKDKELARGIGAAFSTTFWQVIKDELPQNFKLEKFIEKNKSEVREKLHIFYVKWPEGEELEELRDIAEKSFVKACNEMNKE